MPGLDFKRLGHALYQTCVAPWYPRWYLSSMTFKRSQMGSVASGIIFRNHAAAVVVFCEYSFRASCFQIKDSNSTSWWVERKLLTSVIGFRSSLDGPPNDRDSREISAMRLPPGFLRLDKDEEFEVFSSSHQKLFGVTSSRLGKIAL